MVQRQRRRLNLTTHSCLIQEGVNQNHNEVLLHTTRIPITKTTKNHNGKCEQRCGGTGIRVQCWWECKTVQLWWENSKEVPPKKFNRVFPRDPGIPVLRIHTKDTPASPPSHQRYSQQPKGGSKRRCPETDERINKAWSRCTMEYFSLKRKEILTQAANTDEP